MTVRQVSERALVQRLNRRLRDQGLALRKSRVPDHELGTYFVVDVWMNCVLQHDVDIEWLGREEGALRPFESMGVA